MCIYIDVYIIPFVSHMLLAKFRFTNVYHHTDIIALITSAGSGLTTPNQTGSPAKPPAT